MYYFVCTSVLCKISDIIFCDDFFVLPTMHFFELRISSSSCFLCFHVHCCFSTITYIFLTITLFCGIWVLKLCCKCIKISEKKNLHRTKFLQCRKKQTLKITFYIDYKNSRRTTSWLCI